MEWILSTVYASSQEDLQNALQHYIKDIAAFINVTSLLLGDVNQTLIDSNNLVDKGTIGKNLNPFGICWLFVILWIWVSLAPNIHGQIREILVLWL